MKTNLILRYEAISTKTNFLKLFLSDTAFLGFLHVDQQHLRYIEIIYLFPDWLAGFQNN